MPLLVPILEITHERLHGCAPWLVRAALLFSFNRCVTVDQPMHRVIIETCHLWLWRRRRAVSFDHIARIVFRAQQMPGIGLSLTDSDAGGDSSLAVFFIGLALKDPREELRLFTVWQRQPRDPDILDRLAGIRGDSDRLGEEHAVRIVTVLKQLLGVPIGR